LYDASYASRAQHHRVATTALHALRRLSTIASALGHQEERIPDDVSTRGDVDACSRASRALLVNTRGSSSFSDCYNIVVGSTSGITIASLGLIFRVLAFSKSN